MLCTVTSTDGSPHAGAAPQQVAERFVPLLAEVDVVVRRALRQRTGHAHVPDDARRRVVPVPDGEGFGEPGQQGAVRHRQIGVADDGVGLDELVAGGGADAHAAHPAGAALGQDDALDVDAVAQLDAALLGGGGEPGGDGVHAALGEVDALDRVHVGDHAVQGERLVGRQAGVHRLEAEQLLQSVVVEVRRHPVGQASEAAETQQPQRRCDRTEQVERRIEVAGR